MSEDSERARDEAPRNPTSQDDAEAGGATATDTAAPDAAAKADEYLRLAQRAQADLVNFRRRVDQERDEIRGAARLDAVAGLLPVLDDFERAIAAIPQDARELPWVQGILLIERNLRAQVERAGFERIEAQGKPFNPWEHEAVMTDETAEHEEGTVTSVMRPGYRVGGRVVRPAQVTVARPPQAG